MSKQSPLANQPANPATSVVAAAAKAIKQATTTQPRVAPDLYTGTGVPDVLIRLGRNHAFSGPFDSHLTPVQIDMPPRSFLRGDRVAPSFSSTTVQLAHRHTIDLPPGVTVVIGQTGSGKSAFTLGRMAAEANANVDYVLFGEPIDNFVLNRSPIYGPNGARPDGSGVYVATTEEWLAHLIADHAMARSDNTVLIVDSLRYLVYGGTGATGKGGVDVTFLTALTFLDQVFTMSSKSLVVVINPMSDDEAGYTSILTKIEAAVAGVIDVKSTTEVRVNTRNTGRRWQVMQLPSLDQRGAVLGPQIFSRTQASPAVSLSHLSKP